ncbi:flagellar type III secretion system pore protein FliP [Pseudochelatococcus sp. G4_1912]|uniref:flagellar type III secretion system pore protein FliP n=1 Tax=Pseudochelatococcus sp. G4_1912 TaxID=3114288 RepID=UPI0039C702F1
MGLSWPAFALSALLLPVLTLPAFAQIPDLSALIPQGDASAAGRIIQIAALLTVLSVAPGLLIMVTSFTRLIIALSFLRSGLGMQSTPSNIVMTTLAMFMTFYIMSPTFDRAWQGGVVPLMENRITEEQAFTEITEPFREFMLSQVRNKDLRLFADLAEINFPPPAQTPQQGATPNQQDPNVEQVELRVLIPAFLISELRRGFEIGFLIALPFLVIDMIVATLVMSMGMMMMPPTVLALPFKVLFFILIDGWNLLTSGLVRSFF